MDIARGLRQGTAMPTSSTPAARRAAGAGTGSMITDRGQPGPGHAEHVCAGKLVTNDALSYLRQIKNQFADNSEVYYTFLDIMKAFKAQRIDTDGVIVWVKDVFRGQKELILGFNCFLPKGCEIELTDVLDTDDEQQPAQQPDQSTVESERAIGFINKVKTRFAQNEATFHSFLDVIFMYRQGQTTISNVQHEVAVLFMDHPDLTSEFNCFMPNAHEDQGSVVQDVDSDVMVMSSGSSGQGGSCTVSKHKSGSKQEDSARSLVEDLRMSMALQEEFMVRDRGIHDLRPKQPCSNCCKAKRQAKHRTHSVQDMHATAAPVADVQEQVAAAAPASNDCPMNAYELQRAARIAHNQRELQRLGVAEAVNELQHSLGACSGCKCKAANGK